MTRAELINRVADQKTRLHLVNDTLSFLEGDAFDIDEARIEKALSQARDLIDDALDQLRFVVQS